MIHRRADDSPLLVEFLEVARELREQEEEKGLAVKKRGRVKKKAQGPKRTLK